VAVSAGLGCDELGPSQTALWVLVSAMHGRCGVGVISDRHPSEGTAESAESKSKLWIIGI
jgi:hypothetical protein